jgi:ABC-type multidrug transport system ATPase subunit
MAIKKFKIENVKALGLAECESLPKVMIIAGPNGAGKSTLLYEISQKRSGVEITGNTKILYQPPHRAIRKTTVHRSWLSGGLKFIADLLTQGNISGYEGLSFQNASRTPDNIDEAGSTIKHTLGKIENKRQSILTEYIDRSKEANTTSINISDIPDIYEPIKELTKYLLPHLVFQRVDFHNEDNIKCLWKRTDKSGDQEIDIDDLSSGEKSIIILFLPLIENEIHENLKKLEVPTTPSDTIQSEDIVLIIDEPELHLHPDLQAKILSYIRTLSFKKNVQFIVSTHSPTILDQAYDDELYLLTQKTDVTGTQNQLRKIASSIEKLEALKQLTGNAYYITTGRSIICIEGERASDTKVTDVRLLEILYPRSTAYTFVPSGGKGNVINTVKNLRLHLDEEKFSIAVYGLTDKDQGQPSGVEGVFCLPVCMIENLLLVPESISEYLNTNSLRKTPEEVKGIFDTITAGLVEQEISLRVSKRLKAKTIRVTGKNKEEIKASLETQIEEMRSLIPDDATLDVLSGEIKTEVESIVSNNKTLQDFRGKEILAKFYNQEVQASGIPYSKFCYELAQVIAKNQNLDELLNPVFDQIQNT